MSLDFSTVRAVIMDMDGVLWRGQQVLPGAPELIAHLQTQEIPFVLATNNSSRHPLDYVERVASLGLGDIEPWQIVTSGTATASYLQTRYPQGTRLYIVGMDGLQQVITEAGYVVADHDVRAVVVGLDRTFTYDKAAHATHLIRNGADFIGTNGDLTFPTAEGLVPGAGSLLAMLEAATDVRPRIIGKPHGVMFEAALRLLATPAAKTLMIGDRLNTDIEGAQQLGLQTAFILTGVHQRHDIIAYKIQPDIVYETLVGLLRDWQA